MNSTPISIEQYVVNLLPRFSRRRAIPSWPPDAFAICSGLVAQSAAYPKVLSRWPPTQAAKDWSCWAAELGIRWRGSWAKKKSVPAELRKAWGIVVERRRRSVAEISSDNELAECLLIIAAIADQACAGIGSQSNVSIEASSQLFYDKAAELLEPTEFGSTLGLEIHPTRMRVLPKMHTPQSGLTIRSLSMYLSICSPSEVVPYWKPIISGQNPDTLNLLVVPWPFTVLPSDFSESKPLPDEMGNMPEEFGFFVYQPRTRVKGELKKLIEKLYFNAKETMGSIDGVVLPELALQEEEWPEISKWAVAQKIFIAAGVGTPSTGTTHSKNSVYWTFPVLDTETTVVQHKHHRWKLDRPQLVRYGLGGTLTPERKWWEHISLNDRALHFLAHQSIVMSVLICEDLARPDPVGDLLRAVGPNLVIALLMDGPQLSSRWAARYAATLADDPGCSVLSITSLGMALLSKPRNGETASRVVALWKDALNGLQEIALDVGCNALVLTLTTSYQSEWSADGRWDSGFAAYPVLSGVHCIRADAC